jgi:hypothetical protein
MALAVGSCLWASTGTAIAMGSKPVISNFKAAPASVASAGSIVVSATVSGATQCTLSSNKPVAGLPATFSCEAGSVNRDVKMPASTGKKALKYKLQLIAVASTGGKAKKKATVTVSPGGSNPVTGDWHATYGNTTVVEITESGGMFTITATQPVKPTGASCFLPAGTVIARAISETATEKYSGEGSLWSTSNCAFDKWTPLQLVLKAGTLTLAYGSGCGGGCNPVYTRLGKATCTTNTGTIKLSPGLTNTPAVQTMKIKGTLSGCTGDPFTEVKYTAKLGTAAPVSCSVLKAAGEKATGAAQYKWTPKAKASTGTLSLLLTETLGVAFSGEVVTGSYSPLTLSGKVSETYTGAATCSAKAVKKGTFIGSSVTLEQH